MRTTRRNFLATIPALASLLGFKEKEKPISGNAPVRFCEDDQSDVPILSTQWENTYLFLDGGVWKTLDELRLK